MLLASFAVRARSPVEVVEIKPLVSAPAALRYGKLSFVFTENGFCNLDWVGLDGRVHDPQRIDFLHRYLKSLKRAAAEGIQLGGYFYWSVMDNFEWAEGYKARFGLVHVDYATQKRTLKDSAMWYREVIRSNGANI
jgi:beta-glucosidase